MIKLAIVEIRSNFEVFDDKKKFTNRYSFLSDVKDEEDDLESPEMTDETVNAPFDLFEELEILFYLTREKYQNQDFDLKLNKYMHFL